MKIKAAIIGFICSILFLGAAWADNSRTSGFTDISGSWAEEVIYEAQAAGFVSGYGDGQFKPTQNLTRVEALAMINHGLGWSQEASSLDTTQIQYPDDLWAGYKGDIAMAVQKGLLDNSAISAMAFNSPAPRIEVAVWLAKALNLNGDNYALGFSDLESVSLEDQRYLAGVVNEGYMSGYPDQTFRPDGSITRAEMCSIMSRMMHNHKMFPENATYLQGILNKVNNTNFVITIDTKDYFLADSYVIFQNAAKSGFLGLTVGNTANVILNNAGEIIFIGVINGTALGNSKVEIKGHIVNKFTDSVSVFLEDGSLFDVYSDEISFTRQGQEAAFAYTYRGDPITITKVGGNYTKLNIEQGTRKIFGYITSVTKSLIVLNDLDNREVSYNLKDDLKIYNENGSKIDWDDLDEKMGIELWLDSNGDLAEVHVLPQGEYLYGTITNLKVVGAKKITLENEDGDDHTFDMASQVYVSNNDTAKELFDLETDMDVFLLLNSDEQVVRVEIMVNSTSDVSGEITDLKTSGEMYIVVKNSQGNKKYFLDDNVTVNKGTEDKPLSYLSEGMKVELTLDRNDKVNKVNVRTVEDETIYGEITFLKKDGNFKMELETDGERELYYFSDSYKIKGEGDYQDIDYLKKGMEVKITLDSENEIILVEKADTTESYTLKGEISSIRTSGTPKLTLEKSNGDSVNYPFADSYKITEDGSSKKISYLVEGMKVTLTINNSEEITKVVITDSGSAAKVSGEITYLKTSGTCKLTLEKTNGSEESYYFADDYVVRDKDDKSRGIAYLEEGMNVTLTLNEDNDITLVNEDNSSKVSISGEITYVKTSGEARLELEERNGKEHTYYFAKSYTIVEDGINRKIGYLEEGMEVTLTLNSDDEIKKIVIDSDEDTEEVYGTITYLKTSGNKKITIEKSNGKEVSYGISDDVEIYDGNRKRSLGYLEEDMDVNLIINSDDEVIEIEIE